MSTIRICDKCKAPNTEVKVRGFRWMGVMDKCNYKHDMFVKVDLCKVCESKVRGVILKELGMTMRPFTEEED